ncbi:MAG: Uma2 family endonuclease [Oscillatoriaceae cyanobacterium Prado104]|jgi:Uma2 family endonuclease|nr:Uma2 family endonuclease [Oscillatoriaceae cyanobacterium Prado104]
MSQSIPPDRKEQQSGDSPTLTFEEYKVYQSDDDFKYELYKCKLIQMPIPTCLHIKICEYLVYKLQRYIAVRHQNLVVKTGVGVRTEENSSRIPDVVVCNKSVFVQMIAQPIAAILDFDETPLLAIEVVDRDRRSVYMNKRTEYELANVAEYVIVDPTENRQRVRDLAFIDADDVYTEVDYLPGKEMVSAVFPDLRLSVNEILCPPLVEGLIKEEQARLKELRQQAARQPQLADNYHQRAERFAAKLRELGIDPDTV